MSCDYILGEYAGVRLDSCVFRLCQRMQKIACDWFSIMAYILYRAHDTVFNDQG